MNNLPPSTLKQAYGRRTPEPPDEHQDFALPAEKTEREDNYFAAQIRRDGTIGGLKVA